MSAQCQVRARFYEPPAPLQHYFTTFYLVEIEAPDGQRVVDYLHPEWTNLRFFSGDTPDAEAKDGTRLSATAFCVTGPSSHAVRFTVGPTRMWGIGLLPLGWAKFIAAPAADLADAVVDGNTHAAFAQFAPLARAVFGSEADPEIELARISAWFMACATDLPPDAERIMAIHDALVDPDIATVKQLVERSGARQRTVERTCARAFGFSPQLLLRRQRFMRSLAQYLLDPTLKWIGALDGHYHDQAQFVRDFNAFMGMSPRWYGALDKPIIAAVIKARAQFAGRAVQAFDTPQGGAARPVAGGAHSL